MPSPSTQHAAVKATPFRQTAASAAIATSRALVGAFALAALGPPGAGAAEASALSGAERSEGWTRLFDGKTFEGWRGYRKESLPDAGWVIEDGCLKTVPKVKGGELITTKKFGDFELRWEWRLAEGGNNGIKYFVSEDRPKAPGHEYQMLDDARHPDALRGDTHKTAAYYDVLPPAADKPVKPAGEWNSAAIVVKGDRVEHWLNGRMVLAYNPAGVETKAALAKSKFKDFPDFGPKAPGHIMITYHNDECWLRNIQIREFKGN